MQSSSYVLHRIESGGNISYRPNIDPNPCKKFPYYPLSSIYRIIKSQNRSGVPNGGLRVCHIKTPYQNRSQSHDNLFCRKRLGHKHPREPNGYFCVCLPHIDPIPQTYIGNTHAAIRKCQCRPPPPPRHKPPYAPLLSILPQVPPPLPCQSAQI